MAAQVSADPDTRVITFLVAPVNGLITVDVSNEIYSQIKSDWEANPSLQKLKFPFRPVGGDSISATETVGKYTFMSNNEGWRLQPYDADHELTLVGNIFPEDATQKMWLSRTGRTIIIQVERSAQALQLAGSSTTSRIWSIPL